MTDRRLVLLLASTTAFACYSRDGARDTDAGASGGTDTETGSSSSTTGSAGGPSTSSGGPSGDAGTSGASSDGGSTGSPAVDGGLDDLVGALCTWEFDCCSTGEIDYRLGPFTTDAGDCTDRFVQQLHSNDDVNEAPRADLLSTLGFAIRLDRSSPDPEAVSACRDAVAARTCNQPPSPTPAYCTADTGDNPCDLRNLFTGIQTVGGGCSEALASLGYDIECEAGSTCESVDGVWTCVDKGLADEYCEADSTCDQGLYCDLAKGRCAERAGVGDACAFADPNAPDPGTETLPCLESLACDPLSGTCAQPCSQGWPCSADEACPQGQSCVPHDIGDGTYGYCDARGTTNGDRCDTDRDCDDALHCEGGSCAADRSQGTICTAANQCQAGLFCELSVSHTCVIVANANALCSSDAQCNANTTLGCITSNDGARCRTALLTNGDACVPGEKAGEDWCASSVCEDITNNGINDPVCHAGAAVGIACDASPATFDVYQCAPGLYCHDGICKSELDAGGDCEPDGATECLNGECVDVWQGQYCSDAVPSGAQGVATCDGTD